MGWQFLEFTVCCRTVTARGGDGVAGKAVVGN